MAVESYSCHRSETVTGRLCGVLQTGMAGSVPTRSTVPAARSGVTLEHIVEDEPLMTQSSATKQLQHQRNEDAVANDNNNNNNNSQLLTVNRGQSAVLTAASIDQSQGITTDTPWRIAVGCWTCDQQVAGSNPGRPIVEWASC